MQISKFVLVAIALAIAPTNTLAQQFTSSDIKVKYVNKYNLVWNDRGSGAKEDGSFWQPVAPKGFYRLGHLAKLGHGYPDAKTMVISANKRGILTYPTGYQPIWSDRGSGADNDVSIWRPVCQNGFGSLGDVAAKGYNPPSKQEVVCIHNSLLSGAEVNVSIWNDAGSGTDQDFSAWKIDPLNNNSASDGLFIGTASHSRPAVRPRSLLVDTGIRSLPAPPPPPPSTASADICTPPKVRGYCNPGFCNNGTRACQWLKKNPQLARDPKTSACIPASCVGNVGNQGAGTQNPPPPPTSTGTQPPPPPPGQNTRARDLFDYDAGRLVMNLNQPLNNNIDGYVTYTKKLRIPRLRINITATIQVNTTENYYTIELVTPGAKSLANGGLGNRMGMLAYSDDWNLRKDTQAIYANGRSLKAALKDLETKFNGTNGRISFSGRGDPTRGEFVLIIQKK